MIEGQDEPNSGGMSESGRKVAEDILTKEKLKSREKAGGEQQSADAEDAPAEEKPVL